MSFAASKEGLPLSLSVSQGNAHHSKLYVTTVQGIKIRQSGKKPLNKPKIINAYAAYDSEEIRKYNRKRGIKSNIPENRRNKKGKKKGRPYRMKKEEYKYRKSVERLLGWLKSFKRIAVRYEKLATTYTAFILLACILILWRV